MSIFQEGNLQFNFSKAQNAEKFDDKCHGMSHCMKAVDFIIQWESKLFFIEIKDAANPTIPPEHATQSQKDFLEEYKTEILKENLVKKYTDSFLYKWASKDLNNPVSITYIALIETPPYLINQELRNIFKENLQKALPLQKPTRWKQSIIDHLLVLNITEWNKHFSQFPVTRLSHKT